MAKATRVHSTPRKNSTANSDAARLAALSKNDCPVRAIMQQAVAVRKAHDELDAADGSDKDEVSQLRDTTEILLNMASITRAQSPQGALFQLALLNETLHIDLFQNIPSKELQKIIGDEAAREAKDIWLVGDDSLSKIERAGNGPCAA